MNQKEILKEAEEIVKQVAWIAWQGAANAYRMYPDNKHTFNDYWSAAKSQFKEHIAGVESERQRTKALVEALEKIRDWDFENADTIEDSDEAQLVAHKALTLYNQSKETVKT